MQNPLYKSLWKKLEASPPDLKFAPFLEISEKSRFFANYKAAINEIEICEIFSKRKAFEALIFESANAIQRKSFKKIAKKMFKGELNREEYARLFEFVEWNTCNLYHQIINFGNKHLGWPEQQFIEKYHISFLDHWKAAKKSSHSDYYRKAWDSCAFLYWLRHPEKAPSDIDWINRKIDSLSPLWTIAFNPEWAFFFEEDPFIQLIDKKATIDDRFISIYFPEAIVDTKYTAVHAARIRKLLEHGASLPENLSPEGEAWVKKNISFRNDILISS